MTLQPVAPSSPEATAPVETNGHQNQTNGQPAPVEANGQRLSPPHGPSKNRSWLRHWRIGLGVLLTLAILGSGAGAGWWGDGLRRFITGDKSRVDLIPHKVKYEKILLTITERGSLEAEDNRDVVCRVKARSQNTTIATTIRWVIDDGTQVNRGDKLIELDDSGLNEQLKQQKITVDQAYAGLVQAEEGYKIIESQNTSDIATAKLKLELAKIAYEKYDAGEYPQLMKDIEGRLITSASNLSMWEERASWSARMSKPGRRYVTTTQAQADEARRISADLALKKVVEELRVLKDYTAKMTKLDLKGQIAECERAVDRVRKQARAKDVQANADWKSKKSVYEQELVKLDEIKAEIAKCIIYAPQSGLVIYFVPEQARWGSGSQQSTIAQGEPVREGQKLMRIPDLRKMVVNTRVHEAMISRVRGEKIVKTGFAEALQAGLLIGQQPLTTALRQGAFLRMAERPGRKWADLESRKISEGQPVKVKVNAFPDMVLDGEVKSVATVASQQDWLSADVKVYQTMVRIKKSIPGLKPGMDAEVTIYTDSQRDNVLAIPIQAIVGSVEMGSTRRCYVMTPKGTESREITIGLSNDKMAEVTSGLQEGDEVVVNPRLLLTDAEKADYDRSQPSSKGKGGPGKGKDAGKAKGGYPKDGKKG